MQVFDGCRTVQGSGFVGRISGLYVHRPLFSLLREGTYLTQPAGTLYQNVYLPRSEAERFRK